VRAATCGAVRPRASDKQFFVHEIGMHSGGPLGTRQREHVPVRVPCWLAALLPAKSDGLK